jgi:hypothetical protein
MLAIAAELGQIDPLEERLLTFVKLTYLPVNSPFAPPTPHQKMMTFAKEM